VRNRSSELRENQRPPVRNAGPSQHGCGILQQMPTSQMRRASQSSTCSECRQAQSRCCAYIAGQELVENAMAAVIILGQGAAGSVEDRCCSLTVDLKIVRPVFAEVR
jgi:hypothetical protein